ncbi:MAG: tRNA (adenosine(37)-N6)-threonylcarbamoyltransferase complex ATPase subunit type 1 TsaE [bacterium]
MEITIKTAIAMQKFGAVVAKACEPGCTIYLHGELGAGKTTLVRGFLREFGHQGHVRSPTFTLLEPYQLDAALVCHFDLYRLINAEEFAYIGGRDYFSQQSICLIEWPERGRGFLPEADLTCNFDFSAKGKWRRVCLVSVSDKGKNIVGKLNK